MLRSEESAVFREAIELSAREAGSLEVTGERLAELAQHDISSCYSF